MIISHKYKYIFIKATKVAGTSIEVALAKTCDPSDIITKINGYSEDSDEHHYSGDGRNDNGLKEHMTPEEIKEKTSSEIWNNYYKFTVVRNPWDVAVSRYFWEKWNIGKNGDKIIKEGFIKKLFKNLLNLKAYLSIIKTLRFKKNIKNINLFLRKIDKNLTNGKFYFDKKGEPVCDFYIRYENLEEDYKKVCEHLGIPYEKLPRLKTKQRTEKKHYSTYYDEKAKKRIAKVCKREIEYFNYKFEEKNDNIS